MTGNGTRRRRCRARLWLSAAMAVLLACSSVRAQSGLTPQLLFTDLAPPQETPVAPQSPSGLLVSPLTPVEPKVPLQPIGRMPGDAPPKPPSVAVTESKAPGASVQHAHAVSANNAGKIEHALAVDAKDEVIPASCSSCGKAWHGDAPTSWGCCGAGRPPCVPGQRPCYQGACGNSGCGRFFTGLYECLCCPDPCYDPRWLPIADTAFHTAAARPQTQMRMRWNHGVNLQFPDRSEYFWARSDGSGKGPSPPAGQLGYARVDYNEMHMYTEASAGGIAAIMDMPYRSMDPTGGAHSAGFGDMTIGTKSLLFDCELLQVSLQFLTYMPMGNASKGLGVGHVSLEPSLLVGFRLAKDTFYQGQLSEWIPLGGDPAYSGAILHTHSSLNQVLYRILPDVLFVGNFEVHTFSFQDGAYTDPVLGPFQRSGNFTYLSGGPGIRLFICDKIDLGFSATLAFNSPHFAAQLYTTEFRLRF